MRTLIQIKKSNPQARSLSFAMNRFCRQRLRSRLSIIMIVAMLWSQVALAGHALCSMAAMASAAITAVPTAAGHGCEHPTPVNESTLCNAHCSQGEQSNDVGRVPPVPALAPASATGFPAIGILDTKLAPCVELPPPLSWHRPTGHPASLLLI